MGDTERTTNFFFSAQEEEEDEEREAVDSCFDNLDDGARNENKKQHQKKLRRIIGTHHKTGTALMRDVFDSISREFGA